MATKNGNGQQALKTDPTAVAARRQQIPNWARNIINDGVTAREALVMGNHPVNDRDDLLKEIQDQKKRLLSLINGLLKNQKPAA